MITKEFPNIKVVGNALPDHYIPIKINENKVYDANTGKNINYPVTGAFEVRYRGELIFSKKATNMWPNFDEIIN